MFSMTQEQAQKMMRLNNTKLSVNLGVMLQEMDKLDFSKSVPRVEVAKSMASFWVRSMKEYVPMMAKLYGGLVLGSFETKKNIVKALIAETEYGFSEQGVKQTINNMMYQGVALKEQRPSMQ